jgi:uncharacterized membrane protein
MSMQPATGEEHHPVLMKHRDMRRASLQNRIADAITSFAGSMVFVYAHAMWFALWVAANLGAFGSTLEFDKFPFGLLTMIVSLEAIFLSTFLLISQNRQDERRQMLADAEWKLVQRQQSENRLEIKQNSELLTLSQQILELTTAIHELIGRAGRSGAPDEGSP